MHFYYAFEGFLMVVGGFWPLAATFRRILGNCCYMLQMEKIVFPQSGLFLTPNA